MTVAPVKTWVDDRSGTDLYYIDGKLILGVGGVVPLPSLGSYARGSIIRGGGTQWEAYAAQTDGAILIGNGTDIISDASPSIAGLVTLRAGALIQDDQTLILGTDSDGTVKYDEAGNDVMLVAGANWHFDVGVGVGGLADGTLSVVSTNDPLTDLDDPTDYQVNVERRSNTTGSGVGISFALSDSQATVGAAIIHTREDLWSKGDLKFYTKRAAAAATDPVLALTIHSDGNALFAEQVAIDPSDTITTGDGTLHVHTATAGAVAADTAADDLVVENNTNGGISILTPDANPGAIYFGSPTDNAGAFILWQNSTGDMVIGTGTADGSLDFRTGNNTVAIDISNTQNIQLFPTATLDLNGNADALILDADGDTTISAPTDDQIDIQIAGADDFTFTANVFAALDGSVIVAGNDAPETVLFANAGIQVLGTDYSSAAESLARWSNDTGGCNIILSKSRGAGIGATGTAAQSGDSVGTFLFAVDDGTDLNSYCAEIKCAVDGAVAGNDTPGRLTFSTTPGGAAAAIERMRIDQNGKVGIGATLPGAQLHVDQSSATGAIPVLVLDQGDVDEPFIEFIGGTVYTGMSGQNEYLKIKDPNGNTRYLRLFA